MGQVKLLEEELCLACRRSAAVIKSEPGDLAHQTTLCHLPPDTTSCISFPLSSLTGWSQGRKVSLSLFCGSWLVIFNLFSWSLQLHPPSYEVTSELEIILLPATPLGQSFQGSF